MVGVEGDAGGGTNPRDGLAINPEVQDTVDRSQARALPPMAVAGLIVHPHLIDPRDDMAGWRAFNLVDG